MITSEELIDREEFLMNRHSLEYRILEEISQLNTPVGASFLCSKVDASQANICRVLRDLELRGLLHKVSNKGRVLTEDGVSYLQLLQQGINSREYVDVLLDLSSRNDKQVYLDILEARMLLELKTAELAAKRATEQDIRELEEILIRHRRTHSLGKPAEEENLDFHYRIAQIANNPIIYHLLKLVMTQKSAYIHFSVMDYTLTGSTLFHAHIFEAIREHDAKKATNLMYEHLNALIVTLKKIDFEQFLSLSE